MDILKLGLIFLIIIIATKKNKPLYIAMSFGIAATIVLYQIPMKDILHLIWKGIYNKATISLILSFYTITFLQRMLEKRGHLLLAEKSLTNIFNSRRVNAMLAPFIIGLLPSIGAVLIAAPIVDNAGGDYVTREEKTFITSFYRHLSEAFLPTYASILLALKLSDVDMTYFVLAMIPLVILLFFLGFIFYVRKIPKETGLPETEDKRMDTFNLVKSLWSIVLSIAIILVFRLDVYYSVLLVIAASILINRFSFSELRPMFYTALEKKLMFTTLIVMIFKEYLTYTGVIERLPDYFQVLPIPPAIIFGLIFFFGTLIAGTQAIIALTLPLAYATIPNGGLGLLVFLMSVTYMSMQVSPTHICLAVITENNKTSFAALVSKTMPVLISFILLSSLYSYAIYLFM
jgi:hypothetical protein